MPEVSGGRVECVVARVAVVGLGKIGLPLATQFAARGNQVIGVDINERVVDSINQGVPPFPGEADLDHYLDSAIRSGALRATSDFAYALLGTEIVVLVVPLIVDASRQPNYSNLDQAVSAIGKHLEAGTTVVLETTVPVGTTRNRVAKTLERLSGMTDGNDFFVAFSPERVSSGQIFSDLRNYPKIVGGTTSEGLRRAESFYSDALEFNARDDLGRENGVWAVDSAETAEMVKLAETTYRDVNIALANQFAQYCDSAGLDFGAVREAANSQPFSHLHRPGIAVGGHCIPVYPHFYLQNDPAADIVRIARETNERMPLWAVKQVSTYFSGDLKGIKVLILGVSYRSGVKESAFSGVFPLESEFSSRGAHVEVLDPLYTQAELDRLGLKQCNDRSDVQVVVSQTEDPTFSRYSSEDFPAVEFVFDGRGSLHRQNWPGAHFSSVALGV